MYTRIDTRINGGLGCLDGVGQYVNEVGSETGFDEDGAKLEHQLRRTLRGLDPESFDAGHGEIVGALPACTPTSALRRRKRLPSQVLRAGRRYLRDC